MPRIDGVGGWGWGTGRSKRAVQRLLESPRWKTIVAWFTVVMVEGIRSGQLFDIVFESRAKRVSWQIGYGSVEERQRKDSEIVLRFLPEQHEWWSCHSWDGKGCKVSLGEEIRSSVLDRLGLRSQLDIQVMTSMILRAPPVEADWWI